MNQDYFDMLETVQPLVRNIAFVKESNKIEGIYREPTSEEVSAHEKFINLSVITIDDLIEFVGVYEPKAVIRDKRVLTAMIGDYSAPEGGQNIIYKLQDFLEKIDEISPFIFHAAYETLHPFTDCNGRSGRALWVWQMYKKEGVRPDRFLQAFYYQSLDSVR